jgi:hypothetical protein
LLPFQAATQPNYGEKYFNKTAGSSDLDFPLLFVAKFAEDRISLNVIEKCLGPKEKLKPEYFP